MGFVMESPALAYERGIYPGKPRPRITLRIPVDARPTARLPVEEIGLPYAIALRLLAPCVFLRPFS